MPDASPFVVWLPLIGGLFALLSAVASLRRGKRQRLVSNLPTSKTTGVFIGLVELKGTAEAEPALVSSCTKTVLAVAERFPQLRARESFANLQTNLVETEQRIALARGYFNEIATFYNTRLEVVPDRFVAALGGLRPQALMPANEFERAPVEVNLAAIPAAT